MLLNGVLYSSEYRKYNRWYQHADVKFYVSLSYVNGIQWLDFHNEVLIISIGADSGNVLESALVFYYLPQDYKKTCV